MARLKTPADADVLLHVHCFIASLLGILSACTALP